MSEALPGLDEMVRVATRRYNERIDEIALIAYKHGCGFITVEPGAGVTWVKVEPMLHPLTHLEFPTLAQYQQWTEDPNRQIPPPVDRRKLRQAKKLVKAMEKQKKETT